MSHAAILGAGRFSSAVARLLTVSGVPARLWARDEAQRTEVQSQFAGLQVTADIGEATADANVIFFGVPASAVLDVAQMYGDFARGDQIVIHAARGVGPDFALPHQMIRSKSCVRLIGALGGPLHARELASGRPIAAVCGSRFPETIAALRSVAAKTPVRVHDSRDIVGVEVAGAVSNVSAIAAGMAQSLDLGDTPRGILLTHGLVEAQRLGCALGAEPATFTGLAGVGDLIPRSVTSTDRHVELGKRVATGETLEAALQAADGEVEGVVTATEADKLATTLGLSLPLISSVAAVLRGEAKASDKMEEVLRLDDIELGHGLVSRR